MQRYEYQVVPAPRRGEKARGLKTLEDRFAFALTTLMNKMGGEGWEYQRADTLPCDERLGLTGSKTSFQNMLVFRRALADPGSEFLETAPQRLITRDPAPVFAPDPTTELRPQPGPHSAPQKAQTTPEQLSASLLPKPMSGPMLGTAKAPAGAAPALGPANPEVAME